MVDHIVETHKWSVWTEELMSGDATSGFCRPDRPQVDFKDIWSTTLGGFYLHLTLSQHHKNKQETSWKHEWKFPACRHVVVNNAAAGWLAMVTTFKRQQTIVFKVRIVDDMQIKDSGSYAN